MIYRFTARHKITGVLVELFFPSENAARTKNPDLVDFKCIGVKI